MTAYLVRRVIVALVLLWVVGTVVFFSVYLLPGDPAHLILGGLEAHPSEEQLQAVRKQLGLDQPIRVRYAGWFGGLTRLDLGRSLITNRPVSADLAVRFARTAQLVVSSTALTVLVGIPLGIYAARRRGTIFDPLVSAITMVGFSVPVFVAGPILVYAFALWLKLLPSGGYVSLTEGLGRATLHLILPAATLAASPTATAMRMTRSAVLEQLSADYVRTARGKGLTEPRVIGHHVLRNAILPVLTILSLQVGAMFASSVIVETIYNWPGMNLFMLQAINVRDYPVIQAVVLLAASIFVVINFLTDVTYAFLDPRIRYA